MSKRTSESGSVSNGEPRIIWEKLEKAGLVKKEALLLQLYKNAIGDEKGKNGRCPLCLRGGDPVSIKILSSYIFGTPTQAPETPEGEAQNVVTVPEQKDTETWARDWSERSRIMAASPRPLGEESKASGTDAPSSITMRASPPNSPGLIKEN
jgi:hypothetical protein